MSAHTDRIAAYAARALLAAALVVAPLVALLSGGSPRAPLSTRSAVALPLYAARAGRTCDNCHADPSKWKNPQLSKRKCNLSCMGCHINPTGGGLRTVSGRYYAQATLPTWFPSHRPYKDLRRSLSFLKIAKHRRNRLPDPAWGKGALHGSSPMAYDEARYNGLRADPLFLIGLDTRYAFYFTGKNDAVSTDRDKVVAFFPMQLDVHAMLHPVSHLSIFATAGALAKSKGYAATFQRRTPFMLKDVAMMAHQFPYMSYIKVGRFLPTFGTYIDDHTAPTRRMFGLDHGILHSRVSGVEIGAAPNYPYVHASFFRPSENDAFAGDDPDNDDTPSFLGTGWGAALSLGWRDLAWSFGVSGMLRRRDIEKGGDTNDLAVSWSLNPWAWIDWLPLTYLGEVVFGDRQRELSGNRAVRLAAMHQLNWLVHNGVNLRVRYYFADPDYEIRDDHYHRVTFGGDLNLLPGFSIRGEMRVRINPGGGRVNTTDGIVYIRGWY